MSIALTGVWCALLHDQTYMQYPNHKYCTEPLSQPSRGRVIQLDTMLAVFIVYKDCGLTDVAGRYSDGEIGLVS